MSLKKKPVTGMKDILPKEMEIRSYVTSVIEETYKKYGFTRMETPCVEHIENLSSKDGGENEKLIFKILKRGEKLNLETAAAESDLVDGGLRYDLTVPLVRYYSAHENELPSPFKALQMGPVWRADRPQRGRFRQFVQCDIDILGESSNIAEIELILALTEALGKLTFKGFEIKINDRRFLKAMADYAGFEQKDYDTVFITLDKMDKIGKDGCAKELLNEGFGREVIDRYLALFEMTESNTEALTALNALSDIMIKEGKLDAGVRESLSEIITAVNSAKAADFKMVFDPTLVRGMSYYTGTIFEVSLPAFGGSCGGGGRYDEMVGKFTGKSVPACGFSIGFERIIMLLLEGGFEIPGEPSKTAFLIDKKIKGDALTDIMKQAAELRREGKQVLISRMNKNKKFQKEQLNNQGYSDIREFFND